MKFSRVRNAKKIVNGYKLYRNQQFWYLKSAPSHEKVIEIQVYPSSMVAGGFHVP